MVGAPDGSPSPYYRVAEMWWASLEELQAALSSDDGQGILADLPNFAPDGTTLLVSETD